MPEALLLLPLLLAPVVALLFLNLRLSRKLRYPHQLLAAANRRGTASMFFRSLRRYYDIIIDLCIATALAFALAGPGEKPGRKAVVVDCSRSMLAGAPGERPLDIAMKRLLTDASLKEHEAFALAFDPVARKTTILPVSDLVAGQSVEGAARRLQNDFEFFSVDYGEMAVLRARGYGEVVLLTDRLGSRNEGFRVVESGFKVSFAAWPAAARYDRSAESWLVALVETGPREALVVSAWERGQEGFVPLPRDRYLVEEAPGGRTIRISAPGLYRFRERGPWDQLDAEFALRLEPRATRAAAKGAFSERMLRAFPLIETAARPDLVFLDLGEKGPTARHRITSVLRPGDGDLVLDPSLTAARPVAAAFAPGADFALGPSSIANDDLVLAFDAAVGSAGLPPFRTAVPPGARSLLPVGSFYLARTAEGLEALIPPPREFFEPTPAGTIALPPPSRARFAWFLVLVILSVVKLAAWKLLSGKRLFALY